MDKNDMFVILSSPSLIPDQARDLNAIWSWEISVRLKREGGRAAWGGRWLEQLKCTFWLNLLFSQNFSLYKMIILSSQVVKYITLCWIFALEWTCLTSQHLDWSNKSTQTLFELHPVQTMMLQQCCLIKSH